MASLNSSKSRALWCLPVSARCLEIYTSSLLTPSGTVTTCQLETSHAPRHAKTTFKLAVAIHLAFLPLIATQNSVDHPCRPQHSIIIQHASSHQIALLSGLAKIYSNKTIPAIWPQILPAAKMLRWINNWRLVQQQTVKWALFRHRWATTPPSTARYYKTLQVISTGCSTLSSSKSINSCHSKTLQSCWRSRTRPQHILSQWEKMPACFLS